MKAGWEIIRNVVKPYMNVEVSELRAHKMYAAFASEIADTLKAGSSVRLGDVASIRLERKPASQQQKYDMRTGVTRVFDLPARTVVKFRAAKNLAEAVEGVTEIRND